MVHFSDQYGFDQRLRGRRILILFWLRWLDSWCRGRWWCNRLGLFSDLDHLLLEVRLLTTFDGRQTLDASSLVG
jgi:hypothetical protein